MSALQVYLNWANSVLSDCDLPPVVTVDSIRQGKVLCQLIETFWDSSRDERLPHWNLVPGSTTAIDYIQAALCHLESRNIKVNFSAEDILKGDIKSILDLLWILIINYNIHDAGTNQYHQCSIGAGRRALFAWCQKTLAGLQLDKKCSLVKSLCTSDHFLMLLESTPGIKLPAEDLPTKSQHLIALLENIESQFGIKKEILSVPELIAGTIDEQILMIYLALLKWKIEKNQNQLSHPHLWDLTEPASSSPSSSSSLMEQTRCRPIKSQINQLEKQVMPPKQSASIVESFEKQTTNPTVPQTHFESSPTLISNSITTSQQSTTVMTGPQALSKQHFSSSDSFSRQCDNKEDPVENEISDINNSVSYRSPVCTQLYSRSLTPTITFSTARPNYSDFPLSPSLFSRPRSAMGLARWTGNYDSTEIRPNIRSSYPSLLDEEMAKMSNTEQKDKHLITCGNLGSKASQKQTGIRSNTDTYGIPQRKQEIVKTLEEASHNVSTSQQASPLTAKRHREDGIYPFKKVIITKDGDSAQIQTLPVSPEKDVNLWYPSDSMSANPKVPSLENTDKQEKREMNIQERLTSDWEIAQPRPPPLNMSPSSLPVFEMEEGHKMKADSINKRDLCKEPTDTQFSEEHASTSTKCSNQTVERKLITRQASTDEQSFREKQSGSVATGNKIKVVAGQDPDVSSGNGSSENSNPNLNAASVTSRKIDILCIEIGELKKKVMAMETGKTYLADLNRTFQSALDTDIKSPKSYKDLSKRESEQSAASKINSEKQDMSERMNQTWSPSTNGLSDLEAGLEDNGVRHSSLHSLSFHAGFTLNKHLEGNSFQKKKSSPLKTSPGSAISTKDNKKHLWRVGNEGENMSVHQQSSPFSERHITVKTTNAPSSTLVNKSLSHQENIDQLVPVNMKQESGKPTEADQKATFENHVAHDDDHVNSPSKSLLSLVTGSGEVDELLSRYASGGNMILDKVCRLMKQLKQENEKLKSRLQQEMTKLQILSERLHEMQMLREKDAERAQVEQLVQEEQTVLCQENVELRERLNVAEQLNVELKADVQKLQKYKTEIQQTQRNLRERILRAEKDKEILSEELNLLWRQRKAMRQSNYESNVKNTGMTSMEEMSTPPRSRPSLVEAAFSNRLHQAEKKSRSPLTSSPAGQRLSVAAFPVSPVVSSNQENESPDCLFNRHGLGILYPETPKTYRTVSYLERERNCFSVKSRSSPSEASPKESPMCSNIASDLELDQLLDDVKDHSQMSPGIPYGDDDDDDANDSDDYDRDVIQLRKRSRLSWSDENLNRHSENASNCWVAEGSLKRSPRSSSELQLSQAATPTKTGRRRINNVTFNFSSSASNVPSKQRSTLKGILKKANLPTQYNTDGIANGHSKTSVSKTPYSQGPQHRSSEDLFLEISQQDFFDPPSIHGSNAAKHLLESGMGKRWSSYDSLHSKNSQSALQRDFSELDSDAIIKRPSVNPDDINFSFTDHMNSSSKKQQQSQQNTTYSTEFSNMRNYGAFRHFMLDNSMENSPEARPLFGDPNDSRWSFTPYNFYLETLSKQLNEQNRFTEQANPDNSFSSSDAIKSTTKDIAATDINSDPQIEDSAIPMNFPLAKDDDKSTPAKSGPLPHSAEAAGNQKFSSVLSPDQVQFSPTTEADRKAIVRNLCSVFENSDISLDGSEPGSAKKSRSWYDLDKTPPAQLTDEQRNYANTLIEKYTRFPRDRAQNVAT